MRNWLLMVPGNRCCKNAVAGRLKALYGTQFWRILANKAKIACYLRFRREEMGGFRDALYFSPSRARESAAVSFEKFRLRAKDYQKKTGTEPDNLKKRSMRLLRISKKPYVLS